MTLTEAKEAAKKGNYVRPGYYGPGWCMIFLNGDFWDRNPVTGSLLLKRFDARDEEATWKVASAKERKKK